MGRIQFDRYLRLPEFTCWVLCDWLLFSSELGTEY